MSNEFQVESVETKACRKTRWSEEDHVKVDDLVLVVIVAEHREELH